MHALSPRRFLPLPLAARDEEARLLLRAMRLWVMLARGCRSPRPAIESLLGAAAPALCRLMDEATSAWPDPFVTYPPCATAIAPDEDLLLALVADARAGAHAGFEARVADLLAESDRERLWAAAGRLVAERAGLGWGQ
jgi:hypothetical protein